MKQLRLENLLKDLYNLPDKAVYAILNESEKKIQVYGTKNMRSHLIRLIDEMDALNNLEIKRDCIDGPGVLMVLEDSLRDDGHLKVRTNYWIKHYKALGYRFYQDYNPVDLTIRKRLGWKKMRMYYVVEIVNRRGSGEFVGAFWKNSEAEAFLKTHYPGGVIRDVVRAENEASGMWLSQED